MPIFEIYCLQSYFKLNLPKAKPISKPRIRVKTLFKTFNAAEELNHVSQNSKLPHVSVNIFGDIVMVTRIPQSHISATSYRGSDLSKQVQLACDKGHLIFKLQGHKFNFSQFPASIKIDSTLWQPRGLNHSLPQSWKTHPRGLWMQLDFTDSLLIDIPKTNRYKPKV